MRKEIYTEKGAVPKGPYSQAIVADGPMMFVSGQGPVAPASGEMQLGSFKEQAELVFRNITTLLEEAGTSWAHVVRVGVFLADLADFAELNEIYQSCLAKPYPARTTVGAVLPLRMLIEVDCIALIPQG
jgi:2-iminobutanoate/2-iminopropanoate deaminase